VSTYTAPTDLPIDEFADLPVQRRERWLPRMVGVVVVALLAGAGVMYFVHPGLTATNAGSCPSVSSDLKAIDALRSAHQYQAALSLLQIVQREHPRELCPPNSGSIASLSGAIRLDEYQARMALLFAYPHRAGDITSDNAAIQSFRRDESFAVANRIPVRDRESLNQVEGIAYGLGYFPLAAYVWLKEWEQGGNHNLPSINHFYSTEVNIGLELASAGNNASVLRAEHVLETARKVGLRFHLARGEATTELERLAGDNPAAWPPALPSPLLGGRSK